MPKPTVTVYLKRLEAAGFVRREIGARLDRLSAAQQTQLENLLEKLS